MSLASTTVFEARPGAGSATNGGGFVPGSSGTDWSQQNSPQYSVTDGVLSGTTSVTSASANFGADVVGNVACIAGSWYQIVSRTSATTIVVDRATGTATGQTINIGGALDLWETAEPLLTAGMTLWIKATGTTIRTANFVLSATGDSTSGPITVAGYHTTRGDHDGTRPIFTSATSSVDIVRCAANSNLAFRVFDNLEISSTAGARGNGFTGGTGSGFGLFWTIANCFIHGVKNAIIGDVVTYNQFTNLTVINCEISGGTNDAILNCDLTTVDGCYLHGNSGYGFEFKSIGRNTATLAYPIAFRNSVIYGNSLGGIYVQPAAGNATTAGPFLDINRCAVISNTGDGIRNDAPNAKLSMLSLQNSIVYGNSGYGVNITNAAATIVANRNNAYGSNTTGARNNLAVGTNDIALSADPFTARTGNDFTLNTTVGGGAACRAAGFPGSIPGLVAAGSADIGALPHADPAAAGGNVLSIPRRIFVQPCGRPPRRSPIVISGAPAVLVSSPRKVR